MTFEHTDPGTAEALWQSWVELVDHPSLELTRDLPGLVVVAAHPDDETLGAGGLLARAHAAGVPVTVVVATAGEASHPLSTTTSPTELARCRADEVRAAVAVVAPDADVRLLDLPDGALGADDPLLVSTLARFVVPSGWVAAPWRGDGHPDHEAAGKAAAAAAAEVGAVLLEYPIWAWHWGLPGDVRLAWGAAVRLGLSPEERTLKGLAAAEHRTQTAPLSPQPGDEALLHAGFLAHFDRPYELFLMTRPEARPSLPGGWFQDFYVDHGDDPWGFRDRWYEERKRDLTLASLPRRRFRRAFEPGCSNGMLTRRLAERCEEVLALDPAPAAVSAARARTADVPGVRVEAGGISADWPDGLFDLVVLSEVGYYCSSDDLRRVVDATVGSLTDDGVVVACHWRRPVPDYPLTGDEVHAALAGDPRLGLLVRHVEEDFLLDVYARPPVIGVARSEGLT